jgi:hypothetical protein
MPRKLAVAILLVLCVVSACGRREHRAFFDAVSPKEAPPSPLARPLPESALHVRWAPANIPTQLTAGDPLLVRVTFANTGDTTWPDKTMADPKQSSGRNAVRLSYSIVPAGQPDARSLRSRLRSDLIRPLAPGESATLEIVVHAPDQPGDYRLSFELLQESVVWFADLGADTLTFAVRVVPAGAGATPRSTP